MTAVSIPDAGDRSANNQTVFEPESKQPDGIMDVLGLGGGQSCHITPISAAKHEFKDTEQIGRH
jgi:hypothetical protein